MHKIYTRNFHLQKKTLNLPFSNVPQIIKFGSKVRKNNEKFDRALRVSV